MEILYVGNDNLVQLDQVRDAAGVYLNTATVRLTSVTDKAGATVSGVSLPLTLTYVAASNGKYQATIQDTAGFVNGSVYSAQITVDGAGLQALFVLRFVARTRGVT